MTAVLGLRPAVPVRESALTFEPLPASAAAQGLEGRVVRASNTPFLCKLFTTPRSPRQAAALQELIDLREWETDALDRSIMKSAFSWPVHRVVDDSSLQTIGVLIPPAEPRFYFEHDKQFHLREGQHLPRATSIAGKFGALCRLTFLADLASAWDLLARKRLVYGDANSRNIVFATSGSPSVFLLDCDGIQPADRAQGGFRAQASWADPYSSANTLESDNYLFALWVLRVLTLTMTPAPTAPISNGQRRSLGSGTAGLVRLLDRSFQAPGSRPVPGSYIPVLRQLIAQN